MKKAVLPIKIILTAVVCVSFSHIACAKPMYRWIDEHGKVTFSDQVPPSQVQHKRETLDKNAQVIGVTEKPKTKEELLVERRLNELKQQQEKIIAAQRTRDKMLLSSFLDVKTMDATFDSKLKALTAQEKEKLEMIKKLDEEMATQHKEAAKLEIANKKIPDNILAALAEAKKKIDQLKLDIKDIQDRKAKINKNFAADRERFVFLSQAKGQTDTSATPSAQAKQDMNQLGLFTCESNEQCEKAWQVAKNFVKANSTTKLNVDTDKLMMTNDPVLATDLSLSVSKMAGDEGKQQIFLDIRCVETKQGKELCMNPKAEVLRTQFSGYVRLALGGDAAKPETKVAEPAKK